jgi:hypothetical protein
LLPIAGNKYPHCPIRTLADYRRFYGHKHTIVPFRISESTLEPAGPRLAHAFVQAQIKIGFQIRDVHGFGIVAHSEAA